MISIFAIKIKTLSRQKIKTNTLYTIIGNALILLVIGLLLVMLVVGQSLLTDLHDQFSIQVELQEDLSSQDVDQVKALIAQLDQVDPSSILFQDRKVLAKVFKEELELDADDDLLEEALYDALSFKFKNANINSADIIRIEQALLKIPFIKDVNHVEDMSAGLFDNMERLRMIGFILSLILSVVLIVLIYNNTRLAIHSERFKIRKMQLVGAIPWFITKPFVGTSFRIAIISSLVALTMIALALLWASQYVIELSAADIGLTLAKVASILLVISITISVVSTYLIVNRYLRMDVDQLYT